MKCTPSTVSLLGSCESRASMLLVVVLAFSLIMQPSAANIQTRQKELMGPHSSPEGFQVASNTECVASEPVSFSRLLRLDALGSASAVLDEGAGNDQFCATLRDVLNNAFATSCEDDEEMKFPKTIEALEIVPSSSNIIRSNVRGGQDYFSFHLNLNVTCDGTGCTEDSDLFIPTSGPDRCDQVSKSFRCRAKENQNGLDLMPCECPIPKEFHLLDALNEAIKSGPLNEHMDSVMDMLELDIVPACEGLPEKTTFMTTIEIQVSHPGDSLRLEDTEFVNSAFKDLYNDMNTRDDSFCDPEARQIDSIAVARSELKEIDGDFNTTSLWLRVTGTCYGCDPVSTHLFEYGNQETTRKLSEAVLVNAECFCPRNVPLQAPSKADFVARFQDRVIILSDSSLIIAGTNEVQSFPCPTTSDQISVSTIVELKVPDNTADDVTLESQDFSSFEAAFVRSYSMATEEYCDLLFRQVDVAEVTRVVPISNDTVAVQVDLQGSCMGCNGQAISSIFDSYTDFDSQPLLGASSRRKLQEEQCFCPLDSPNRAIAEEEYIVGLQQAVLTEPSRDQIEAVQPCYLKESFENAILVTAKSSVDLSGYETYLADSFRSAANRNLGRDDICDPKFREVIDVTAQVGSFDSIQFSESPTQSPTFFPSAAPSAMPSFNILLNETVSSASNVPSSGPSASPTLEPTPLFDSYTQYIAFFFTGTCRGCQGDNYLGNDQIFDRRMAQQERREQETGPSSSKERRAQEAGPSSSCYCPLDAIRFQETALALLESLQEEINENPNIPEGTIVDSLTEVTPVSCEPSKNTFESNIVKIDISVIGELDVDTILLIAASTYNEMNLDSYCDPWFRQIFDTNLIGTFSPLALSQVEDESNGGCQDYTIEVSFQGECRGCSDGVSILETRTEASRKLESLAQDSRGKLALRRAVEETNPEKCFCTDDAVADRAPSYDEFKQRLEENIRSVSNLEKVVCEVKEVSGEESSESPSAEDRGSEPPTLLLEFSSNPAAVLSSQPSQYRSKIPSDIPSTVPSASPTVDDRGSEPPTMLLDISSNSTDIPSDMPSTVPSLVPSTSLSALQSSVSTTSMVPSMSHSSSPSASVYPSELPSSVPTSCIAESACNPQKACQRSENLCVGPDSCSGKNSCRATLNADIESNSCIGQSACQSLTGTVGDNSCQGASSCGLSAVKNQLIIGDKSCLGDESCFQIKSSTKRRNRDKDTVIGDGSCQAAGSCSNFRGVSIGSNSCNCEGCCSCFATGELTDEIPSDSCNVRGECCSTDAPTGAPSSRPTAAPSTTPPTATPSTAPPTERIPTDAPTFIFPTEAPTITSLADCKNSICGNNIVACLTDPALLSDPNSPHNRALDWIADSGYWIADGENGLEFSQRYITGIMMFSSDCVDTEADLPSCFGINKYEPICDAYGIYCNAAGEITDIDFISIGKFSYDLAGRLPREIGALTALEYLDVSSNDLTGPIPSEAGLLTQLYYLDFGGNQLTGTIPTELAQLTASVELYLNVNQLTGTIPTQLGQLAAVEWLALSNNKLTGTIPTELGQLTALEGLVLWNNQLTGTIPVALTQLTNLNYLYLAVNNLAGTIPAQLSQLTALQDVELWDNQLTGTIPSELGQLTVLTWLDLSSNQLTGTLPPQLGQMTALYYLDLSNNQLTGTIPVALTQLINLEYLYLDQNNLTGQVPSGFCAAPFPDWSSSSFSDLHADCDDSVCEVQCDCCNNCLDANGSICPTTSSGPTPIGSIADCQGAGSPSDIVSCISGPDLFSDPATRQSEALQWILDSTEVNNWDGLELSQRYVLGVFWAGSSCGLGCFGSPDTPICDFFEVDCNANNEIIRLSGEDGGSLPREIGALTTLASLVTGCGLASGPIPSEMGLLRQLTTLNIFYGSLSGTIPTTLGQMTALASLGLAGNVLTGTIPTELGQLTALTRLQLDENQLTSTIPPQLFQLTALIELTLEDNLLTGTIPTQLGQLTALTGLRLSINPLTGTLPTELGQMTALKGLPLSGLQLTGTIPAQLGQLTALTDLFLYNNQLTGAIPIQLGQLLALRRLQLYSNQLTGTIPTELTQLINLYDLRIQNNNLTGQVPSGFCSAPFPDWRNSFNDFLYADCISPVQCDCCDLCYDESGACVVWDTFNGGFTPGNCV